jgi:hypothetical protein
VKIRIRTTPREREIDGIKLDRFRPGTVCNVPTSLGSWLIVEGYAMPEMRSSQRGRDRFEPHFSVNRVVDHAAERRRKRFRQS